MLDLMKTFMLVIFIALMGYLLIAGFLDEMGEEQDRAAAMQFE